MGNLPRGLSLNNPGNIRISETHWLGKMTPSNDPAFETFWEINYGIRAAAKIFLSYSRSHGLSSIAQYINRWAPPADHNPTTEYVNFIAQHCGVDPNNSYNVVNRENLCRLLDGIFRFELGGNYVTPKQIAAGVDEALGVPIA